MNEYELFDVFTSFQTSFHGWTATYFSAVTAYLVAAYAIGANLKRSQSLIITACFVLFAALAIYAATANALRMVALTSEIRALNPNREFLINIPVVAVVSATQVLGLFVSLKFMWDVRHPRTR